MGHKPSGGMAKCTLATLRNAGRAGAEVVVVHDTIKSLICVTIRMRDRTATLAAQTLLLA